jgi:ABC-type antimicrobial peptide transport system permease subunit
MGTELSWATVLPPTLFVYVMALFVGLIPAWRITRKHITDALRAR